MSAKLSWDKIGLLGLIKNKLRLAAHNAGLWVDDVPVVSHPVVEGPRWVREQASSETLYRHGCITGRHGSVLDGIPRSALNARGARSRAQSLQTYYYELQTA